jgi:hypothetical protein
MDMKDFVQRFAVQIILVSIMIFSLNGCIVYTVADAAVSVAATGVKVVAKTVETAVDIVTPSKNDK